MERIIMQNRPIDNPGWKRLDNAAKIFPSNSNKIDTKVFRFTCTLKKEVDQALLQRALDRTLEEFPFYNCVIRNGLFWFYLEESPLKAKVVKEEAPPCSPLFNTQADTLLFQVSFYLKKINLEVYHALSDGTGAMQFLRCLVCFYLAFMWGEEGKDSKALLQKASLSVNGASTRQRSEDSFQKYYAPENRIKQTKEPLSYRFKGEKIPEGRMRIIEGRMRVSELLALSKEHGTTLTIFLGSVLVRAIGEEMAVRDREKPVVLSVPVDLRNYFSSGTMRNFFGVISVGYDFSVRNGELSDIASQLSDGFKRELTVERLERKISGFTSIEKNPLIRVVPLPVKNFFMMWAGKFAHFKNTLSFSNLGIVRLDAPFSDGVEDFSVMASTDRLSCCLCSFKDTFCITFTSIFESTAVQRRFFTALSKMGIEVHIQSNIVGSDETEYQASLKQKKLEFEGKAAERTEHTPPLSKKEAKEKKKNARILIKKELKAQKIRRKAAKKRLEAYRKEKRQKILKIKKYNAKKRKNKERTK